MMKTNQFVTQVLCFMLLANALNTLGQVRLPRLLSDGMVLQRESEVKIRGWASAGEKITMQFIETTYNTVTLPDGSWEIKLRDLKPGGPYKMTIAASDTVTIDDILIGDVWVASGQSNMETTMERVSPLYEKEIADCENNFIRYYEVPKTYNFKGPRQDINGGKWLPVKPSTIRPFSAVCYFFARALYEEYKIPVGIINAAVGGSPAEAWMSGEALKKFPVYYEEAQRFRDDSLIKQITSTDWSRINAWYDKLGTLDAGYSTSSLPWYSPELNTTDWPVMMLPGTWVDEKQGILNGSVWVRKDFMVPDSMAGKLAKLLLGRIVDRDSVFVNGIFVGATSYQYPPRRYEIPAGLLKPGKNTLVIRVISNLGKGEFVEDKPYRITAGNDTIDLKGEWKYKIGAVMEPLEGQTFVQFKPEGLFNAMIAPLSSFCIKGIIWYQGESNDTRADEYVTLFPALINDWRTSWNNPVLPFAYVQLPNLGKPPEIPEENNWAQLREAQLKALTVPHTGMVVTIDVGEWNDVHPLNKKDVGERLALVARKLAYGDNQVVYSGPLYKSMEIKKHKMILTFSETGSGLVFKGEGSHTNFAVAGKDGIFKWANAIIQNNKVVVWNDAIKEPVFVRYAWAGNPAGPKLYNQEGLPASPFRAGAIEGQK